jgi:serine/threonine protein kinase
LRAANPDSPGAAVGRYRLIERIGEGGFADVYRAEQIEPVRREVAVKIIKPGMDTRAVIARFEAERQALAMMDHPNIARVFDAGALGENTKRKSQIANKLQVQSSNLAEHDPAHAVAAPGLASCDLELAWDLGLGTCDFDPCLGRPYFVMELIRGVPITRFKSNSTVNTATPSRRVHDDCRAIVVL